MTAMYARRVIALLIFATANAALAQAPATYPTKPVKDAGLELE